MKVEQFLYHEARLLDTQQYEAWLELFTDDLEVYERVQRGLSSGAAEWVYIARGAGRDIDERDGTRRGATGTSEVFIRAQFRAWLDYMNER